MDTSDAPAFPVPDGNEDSVDIYEDLDFGSSSNNVVPEKSAPAGLKEAMDLFEEIVTEEQQSKDASYTELKSRFQAAQSQITELHRRLEQLELQNTSLSKENYRLKMNISILLQTARQEVTRKDAEIQRLNQQFNKGHYNQSRNLRDPGCSSRDQRPVPPPVLSAPLAASQPPPRPIHLSPLAHMPSKGAVASPVPPAASEPPPRPTDLPPLNHKPPDAAAPLPPLPKEPPCLPDTSSLPPSRKEDPCLPDLSHLPPAPPSCSLPSRPPLPKSSLRDDFPVPSRRETEKRPEPGSRSSQQSSSAGFIRPSREDCHSSEKPEKKRHHTDKHRDKKHKESERKSTTASNASIERRERRDTYKDQTSNSRDSKSGENKPKVPTSESDRGKGHGSKEGLSREHRRDGTRDRHSRGSDSKEHKKSSSERHRDSSRCERRLSKDQSSKEGRQLRRDEDGSKRHRRDLHSKEKHSSKEHSKKNSQSSERSSKEKTVGEKDTAEENSSNRKLCFMETLNLTLSPAKKPGVVCEGGQEEPATADNTPEEDSSQPNVEDMCVIDEVDSSEPEAASRNCPEAASGDYPEPSDEAITVKTPDKSKDVDSQQETADSINTASEKELKDNPVHSTSVSNAAPSQIKDTFPKFVSSPVTETREETLKDCHANTSEDSSSLNQPEAESNYEPIISKSTKSIREDVVSINVEGQSNVQSKSPDIQPQNCHLASPTSNQIKDVSSQERASKEVETVSSSISLESLPQEGLSLPEAIDFLTQSTEDCSSRVYSEPSSSTGCVGVSKVSSTTQENPALDRYSEITKTPKKTLSPAKFLSPARSSEKSTKPSSSVPLFHDEDSMMRTLSSLKRIPDAISPLRSPVRIAKRNLPHLLKPGHVKSLHKEFSSAPTDAISKKVDVNKENKYPGSPAKADAVDKASDVPSDTELEEGEILSESDEAASPLPTTKRAKLTRPIRIKASPKCVLKRNSEEKCVLFKDTSESSETVQSPPNKSRFKTVSPAATKASFSSIEEVMDTFKLVRSEIRKKYMKLHKTFPKKSFYGVMENFQESFIEFVDGADFGQICNHTGELKTKLKKIIASVFNKVLNNGIVKRIFEQQAVDLKQKLWDFVDVQVEYLFKDVHTTLKSSCKPTRSPVEHVNAKENEKPHKQSPVKKKELQSPPRLRRIKPCAIMPYRTGLGSRGKGIRISHDKSDEADPQSRSDRGTVVSIVPSTPEKGSTSLRVAHNGSLLDKTDFELLTEQQASSLTFNLVRDSQMGEIFKCLLQGSDLLDSSGVGDQSTWALSTPRKDGERIITITTPNKFHSPSKFLSPNKFESPSRLITTWSSISPRKVSSPRSKVLLNPALFDESCLLEVPSENKSIQRPYSILAEDLAVSLTIPSPLKSDSHLSFLQPPPMQVVSTPDSVLSAHICEDALLDEADATEHDIHLTLDTDNSSCGSSASVDSQGGQFLFKPELPMQALVMERSNDHFIVKIRQAASANSTLIANESLNQTLTEIVDCQETVVLNQPQSKTSPSIEIQAEEDNAQTLDLASHSRTETCISVKARKLDKSHSKTFPHKFPQSPTSEFRKMNKACTEEALVLRSARHKVQQSRKGAETQDTPQGSSDCSVVPLSQASSSHTSDSDREEMVSESERSLTIAEELESTPEKDKDRKRKRNQGKTRAKRNRTEEESTKETNEETAGGPEEALSPNSLSAKNVIRRKGEVVMAWTRDEDRAILIELKTKGPSRETFSSLSEKLNKPSGQIAQRFHQLMKLFKKMDT